MNGVDAAWAEVSVCVVTCNEERNLPRCLDSVRPCGEIVVVDSGSTDGTRRVASEHGARWLERAWTGFGDQRNFGAEHATRAWVLFLDADEWLEPGLRAEIAARITAADAPVAMEFRRCSEFLGRAVRHGDWADDRVVRLCRRGAGAWRGLEPHPVLAVEGRVERARGTLGHRPYDSIDVFQRKIESYALTWARGAVAQGARGGMITGSLRAAWRWVRGYVLRAGWMDGLAGWVIAVQNSRMVWLKYAWLARLRRGERPA
jgi:glycosyltransferase involved in cell wall biosynthesis